MAPAFPSRVVPAIKEEIPRWLDQWKFTRFVTLATNDPGQAGRIDALRRLLRKWDAAINHAILGREWAVRDADRIFAFYALEKPRSNPHWHGLIRFFGAEDERRRQEEVFDRVAERHWQRLIPSGTVDIQPIYNQSGVAEYVAKTLGHPLSYEFFVVPDELKLG
jgi:hypothetical protein